MEKLNKCLACQHENFTSIQKTQAMMHPSGASFNFDQCNQCGLVFLNPRVPVEELSEYYSEWYLPYRGDAAWGKYGMLVAGDQKKVDQKRIETVTKYVTLNSDSTVLDIGCGKPDFLKLLSEKYPCRAIGIDFSDSGWAMSKSLYANIELHVGEIESVKEFPAPDLITMWHYLEHDYDPGATLQALKTRSHANTHLVVEVPNFDSKTRKDYGVHWAGYHTPRHTALWTPETMKTLMENNGWKVVRSYPYGTLDPYTLKWMSEMEKRGIDWSKSMESEFWGYVRGKMAYLPVTMLEKQRSLGFMTCVAVPAAN